MANETHNFLKANWSELEAIVAPHLEPIRESLLKQHRVYQSEEVAQARVSRRLKVCLESIDQCYSKVGFQVNIANEFFFSMERYTACGGAYMMYNFGASHKVTPELCRDVLFWIVDTLAEQSHDEDWDEDEEPFYDMYMNNKRLIISMVEIGRWSWAANYHGDLRLVDIPKVEEPTMQHKPLYECFMKYCAKVNDRLWFNKNSNNIIHDMEVIVK